MKSARWSVYVRVCVLWTHQHGKCVLVQFFFSSLDASESVHNFSTAFICWKRKGIETFSLPICVRFFLVHFICRYRMYCIERLAYLSCKRGKVEYDYNMSKSFKPKSTLLLSQQRCNIKQKSKKKVSKTYSLLTINFDVLYTIHSTTTKAFELMLQCLLICLLQEIVIILTNHFKLSFLLLY